MGRREAMLRLTSESPFLLHLAKTEAYPYRHGRPLVEFDKAAERRLRLKIDLYIVPTVALLYLFCFIDRANIGKSHLKRALVFSD